LRRRVAVIGGGITGLAACYQLEKLGFESITLFEVASRLGGKLRTEIHSDFLVEHGPDSIFTRQKSILDLIDELGLSEEVIEPATRGFGIYLDGAVRPIPPGLSRVAKVDIEALSSFPYLSEAAKAAVRAESEVPPNLDVDESVAGFFRRRFGIEYASKIAEPLFAGTHGGSAEALSMAALYPDYRAAERQYGSLAAASESGAVASTAKFVSFKGGLEALSKGICSRLRFTKVRMRPVCAVSKDQRLLVENEEFDAAILATPAHDAAEILSGYGEVSGALSQIQANSSVIVSLRYPAADDMLGLRGTGFLVPEAEDLATRGATWSSMKWRSRSTAGHALVRVFMRWREDSDDGLLEDAKEALRLMVGIEMEPEYWQVHRWRKGLPIYGIGHAELVNDISQKLLRLAPIHLAGQSYRGVGIPDCVRQGIEAAEALAAGS
jgi:oxygen-dependent protoporphyrinogen oxidase